MVPLHDIAKHVPALTNNHWEDGELSEVPGFGGHAESYYAATAAKNMENCHAPLAGNATADVCIIGGGFTGISAALNLAERGFSVIVLEARQIGWGASGHNGGQAILGFNREMSHLEKTLGQNPARELWSMACEAIDIIDDRVRRHDIACDLKWGQLHAITKSGHMDGYVREVAHLANTYGYDRLALLDRGGVRQAVASDRYIGGVVDKGSGHLHPLNYVLGLAGAARAAGATIHENSAVLKVNLEGAQPVAATGKGRVGADFLVLAGNAYLDGLGLDLHRRIMPVGTYICATEQLGPQRAGKLIPDDVAVTDDRFVLDYFRLSADHRMLFGGAVSYSTHQPADLRRYMRRRMLRVFPQLSDAEIAFAWGGLVAITMNRLPDFGRVGDRVYYAHGFSGHGVALTGLAGRLIADAIAGQLERFDVFARIPHRDFPGGKWMRTPILVLAMAWARLRDLL